MSPKQELALAIVLWQQYNQAHQDCGHTQKSTNVVCKLNLPVAERAIQMAQDAGVKEEYFRLLFIFPVTEVTFTELEKWDKTELEIYLTDDSNFTNMPEEPCGTKRTKKMAPWSVLKGRRKPKK